MWERSDVISYISDSHKELHGFRPRPNWDEIPTPELQAWADRLSAQIRQAVEEEAQEKRQWAAKRAGYFAAPQWSIGDLGKL